MAGSNFFNPKSEVDRGELTQSAGREGHSSETTDCTDGCGGDLLESPRRFVRSGVHLAIFQKTMIRHQPL
jgi:hypothetical protein